MKLFNALDIFSGIGISRLAFKKAFNHSISFLAFSDTDQRAIATYNLNFKTKLGNLGDINYISTDALPKIHIIIAGYPLIKTILPPAPRSFETEFTCLNHACLFVPFVALVRKLKPLIVFTESTKIGTGRVNIKRFTTIKNSIALNGYKPFFASLNSLDFALPQHKLRTYTVYFRNDIAPQSFSFPTPTPSSACIGDVLQDAPIPEKYYLTEHYLNTLKKNLIKNTELGNRFSYQLITPRDPAFALVAGGAGIKKNLIVDHRHLPFSPPKKPEKIKNASDIRKLTPREFLRIQGAPDSFITADSDTDLYRQIFAASAFAPTFQIASQIASFCHALKIPKE